MYDRLVYYLSYCPVSSSGKKSISIGKEEWDKHVGYFASFQGALLLEIGIVSRHECLYS